MSGFAFSPQFSQRWLTTPTAVKQTIMQELGDIITLLQPETPLEGYRFSVDNLHDSIEDLMQQEAQRQAQLRLEAQQAYEQGQQEAQARLQADMEQAHLEQQHAQQPLAEHMAQLANASATDTPDRKPSANLADTGHTPPNEDTDTDLAQRLEQDRLAIEQLEQERLLAKQAFAQQNTPSTSTQTVYAIDNTVKSGVSVNHHDDNNTLSVTSTGPSQALTPPEIETIKQDIIKQLQGYLDNYLLESITFMNDDLNKWLKAEVEKQLNERLSQSH